MHLSLCYVHKGEGVRVAANCFPFMLCSWYVRSGWKGGTGWNGHRLESVLKHAHAHRAHSAGTVIAKEALQMAQTDAILLQVWDGIVLTGKGEENLAASVVPVAGAGHVQDMVPPGQVQSLLPLFDVPKQVTQALFGSMYSDA